MATSLTLDLRLDPVFPLGRGDYEGVIGRKNYGMKAILKNMGSDGEIDRITIAAGQVLKAKLYFNRLSAGASERFDQYCREINIELQTHPMDSSIKCIAMQSIKGREFIETLSRLVNNFNLNESARPVLSQISHAINLEYQTNLPLVSGPYNNPVFNIVGFDIPTKGVTYSWKKDTPSLSTGYETLKFPDGISIKFFRINGTGGVNGTRGTEFVAGSFDVYKHEDKPQFKVFATCEQTRGDDRGYYWGERQRAFVKSLAPLGINNYGRFSDSGVTFYTNNLAQFRDLVALFCANLAFPERRNELRVELEKMFALGEQLILGINQSASGSLSNPN